MLASVLVPPGFPFWRSCTSSLLSSLARPGALCRAPPPRSCVGRPQGRSPRRSPPGGCSFLRARRVVLGRILSPCSCPPRRPRGYARSSPWTGSSAQGLSVVLAWRRTGAGGRVATGPPNLIIHKSRSVCCPTRSRHEAAPPHIAPPPVLMLPRSPARPRPPRAPPPRLPHQGTPSPVSPRPPRLASRPHPCPTLAETLQHRPLGRNNNSPTAAARDRQRRASRGRQGVAETRYLRPQVRGNDSPHTAPKRGRQRCANRGRQGRANDAPATAAGQRKNRRGSRRGALMFQPRPPSGGRDAPTPTAKSGQRCANRGRRRGPTTRPPRPQGKNKRGPDAAAREGR